MKKIKLGKYQHFKGTLYKVLGLGFHSETLKKFVIYQALYNSKKFGNKAFWVRPYENFFSKVSINGHKIPRFKYISKI